MKGKFKKKPLDDLRVQFRGLHRMKYQAAEELDRAMREYFDRQDAAGLSYTVAGLVSHLGFSSRQTLEDYRCREEFHEVVERAFLHIEDQRNQQLVKGQGVVAGQIFDLKVNHKWRDKDAERPDDRGPNKVIVVPVLPGSLDMGQWAAFYKQMIESRSQPAESIDITPERVQIQDTQQAHP